MLLNKNIQIKECLSYEAKKGVWDAFFKVYSDNSHGIQNIDNYIEKVSKLARIIAAYDNEQVIGFIAFYANNYDEKIAYLTQGLVIKDYQKCNIGKKLFKACEVVCKKEGFKYLKLEVNKDNINAIGFHSHYGFVKKEEKENSFYMVKEI